MRILHISASYLPATRYGGTIVSVHGLCAALARRGHEVHVFTTSVDGPGDSPVRHGEATPLDGVSVWYFQSRVGRRLYWAPDLARALDAQIAQFDVVHTHAVFLWPMWAAMSRAHARQVPYVVSPRGMLEKALIEQKSAAIKAVLIGMIEKRHLERAAAIHVTSRREAEELLKFGFDLPPIYEVPNGIDLDVAASGAVSPAVANAIAAGPYALFLGRVSWKKGLDRLVSALPNVPDLRVIVAGPDEGGHRAVMEQQAARAGVRNRIVFVDEVRGADKAALLSSMLFLVLPSYSENFGNVVLEAFAHGRPVIVTREVGLADAVHDAGAGLVVDGMPGALGTALATLTTDAALRLTMGNQGRAVLERQFLWPSVAERIERVYDDVRSRTH